MKLANTQTIREFLERALKDLPKDYDTLREIERRLFPTNRSRL